MKRLLLVLLCFISVLRLFSQTPEESALFDKINQHRDSLGLKKLVWDTAVYNMSTHHAKYITIINSAPYNKNSSTHDENINVSGFERLPSVFDRFNKFVKTSKFNPSIENCVFSNIPTSFNGKKIDMPNKLYLLWLTSKIGHKENMEDKTVTKGACSILYYNKVFAVAVFNAY